MERSRGFYATLLETIDYRTWHEPAPGLVGFGPRSATSEPLATVWLRSGQETSTGTLISFTVTTRALVDRAHRRGLEAGGRNGGDPQLRPEFHPAYYSGYLLDPDGVTVELVSHRSA
jgi:hypothetical protein